MYAALFLTSTLSHTDEMRPTVKTWVRIDDAMDIFAEHGVGGVTGLLFTAFAASSQITALDGVNMSTKGGFLDRNWSQLHIQVVYVLAAATYTFAASVLLLMVINYIPGLHLRCTEEEEAMGMDVVDVSFFAYCCHLG
jgi:Amt family ammonium transporter